ncbi:MAG: SDR family oxidoreductase [Myxococcota bacterium]
MKLSDLKVVVTGGASGMGRCFSLELARGGAAVMVADLDADKMAEVQAAAAGLPGSIHTIKCNVADEADVVALFEQAHAQLGGLNGLVNNAGIFRDGLLVKPDKETGTIKKMSLDQWNAVIAVDLTGPFLCTREFAAKVISTQTRESCIVNISSVARHGNPGQSNYSAAKAGLVADTKLWSSELARYGIRVGAIAPGFVDTPILQGMRPEVLEGMLKAVPLRRVGRPEEIFAAVKFIFECDYFTGRCVDVDGGITM